jgi:POT family proton-dependent oligopeptide transporter
MGINLGALLGNFICAQVGDVKHIDPVTHQEIRDLAAFKWGFLAASGAMIVGTIVFFFLKNKYIVTPEGKPIGMKPSFTPAVSAEGAVTGLAMDSGAEPEIKTAESDKAHFTAGSMLMCLAIIVGLTFGFHFLSFDPEAAKHNPIKEWLYPFIYSAGLGLAALIISDKTITKVERQRITVLYIVSFFVIFFWACFEQAGASLTFIADQQTDLNLFGWEMPPAQVQNFNAFFIIVLAFPFSWLWIQLAKKNADPISPAKQALGLLLMAVGYYILATQVKGLANTAKIGVIWLGVMYLFHTMGELCLSPIGLSLVAKLAPKRFSSLLMGVWFLANAAGYALCGTLGSLLPNTGPKFLEAQKAGIDLQAIMDKTIQATPEQLAKLKELNIRPDYPVFAGFTLHNLYEFVLMFVILPAVAGILLLGISPFLKKMMHGVR